MSEIFNYLLQHPLMMTMIFIVLSTIIAAFIKGRARDKCLKAFNQFTVTVEDAAGKYIWGQLRVESSGLELTYPEANKDADGHVESSYMIYKYEYGNVSALIRYHHLLNPESLKRREAELERTYHPGWCRRTKRRLVNIFKTIRDTIMEVSNVLMAQAKKTTAAGGLLSAQDKYVNQMKNEVIGSVDTAYEPLLEKYIGHRVVAEFVHKDQPVELVGVLKDYTAEYMELLDVSYWFNGSDERKPADIILPRKRAVVRHSAE